MKKTMKRRLLIAIFTLVVFAIWAVSNIIYTLISDQQTYSKVPLAEYNNLFSQDVQSKLQILATTTSKNRLPVSTYVFNEKFNISVLKVTLSSASTLEKIIEYRNKYSNKWLNAVYGNLPSFNFNMSIKAGKTVPVSQLYFQFSGDTIKSIVKSDSVFCYYYKFRSFSIHYNDEPYDIIANADVSNIPASLIFKRRGQFLYIILMTVANGDEQMPPDALYSIIRK
jgi:hypothetical protein